MLLETIRLVLIESFVFPYMFNSKFCSVNSANIIFTDYVLAQGVENTSELKFRPDEEYLENEKFSTYNPTTVHRFDLYETYQAQQSINKKHTRDNNTSNEKDDFLFRNLNFEIIYTCSNQPTTGSSTKYPIKNDFSDFSIQFLKLRTNKEKSEICVEFVVCFSRVKQMIIDGTDLIEDLYNKSDHAEHVATINVYAFPDDLDINEVYEGKLSSTEQKQLLNFSEILEGDDNSDKTEDFPLIGIVSITRHIDFTKINIFNKESKDTVVTFEPLNDSIWFGINCLFEYSIDKLESGLESKKLKEIVKAADLVSGMKNQAVPETRISTMIPKKAYTDINEYMKERRNEFLEKIDTDVLFFSTLNLLNHSQTIKITGFGFTINKKDYNNFNIENVYRYCSSYNEKNELKNALRKLLFQNMENPNLLLPGSIYQHTAFPPNQGATTINKQKRLQGNDKNTFQSDTTESNTPSNEKNSSKIIIIVAIGVVAVGAIGGLVYSFIL